LAFGVLVISLVDNILRPILVSKAQNALITWLLVSTLGGMALFGLNSLSSRPVVAMFMATWRLLRKRARLIAGRGSQQCHWRHHLSPFRHQRHLSRLLSAGANTTAVNDQARRSSVALKFWRWGTRLSRWNVYVLNASIYAPLQVCSTMCSRGAPPRPVQTGVAAAKVMA
jgi:hypothetical protein